MSEYCQHCGRWVNREEHQRANQHHTLYSEIPNVEDDMRREQEISEYEQEREDSQNY